MSSHINADLYWDKSDIESHIEDLKKFKKLVADVKGANVIDDAIDLAEEICSEIGWEIEWDEDDD